MLGAAIGLACDLEVSSCEHLGSVRAIVAMQPAQTGDR